MNPMFVIFSTKYTEHKKKAVFYSNTKSEHSLLKSSILYQFLPKVPWYWSGLAQIKNKNWRLPMFFNKNLWTFFSIQMCYGYVTESTDKPHNISAS